MYDKIVVMRRYDDNKGEVRSVTIGFFDKTGQLQVELPQVSGKLFPNGVQQGREVVFNFPAQIFEIKK